jgi:ATP adenylyltransferase
MAYIQSNKNEEGCVFCVEMSRTDGPENLILFRGKKNYVILNRFPYTNGHLMIVPFDHKASLEQLDSETRAEMMELTARGIHVLKSEYCPQGFNLGINIGEAAGAGIAEHIHFHIVPRWSGDTNFMTTLAETRVVPEDLQDSYWRLKNAWDNFS